MENANKKHILMIDDEETVLTLNQRVLKRASGGAVLCFKARTLAEARNALRDKERDFDLIILDIMLPDGSGLDFADEIHAESYAPILMLSAKNTPKDIIAGAARGGDNYITKPYDPDAMAALALAMLRREAGRVKAEPLKTVTLESLTIDIVAGRAFLSGDDMLLTPKEFALLSMLVQNNGTTVSAQWLYEQIWKVPIGDDKRTLQKHISVLRKKLEDGKCGYTVRAVYGEGYCFEKI